MTADAANHRVAIGNFKWSNPDVSVDLGEHVTWHWVGPDTVHSVTGDSLNDVGIDSDPNTGLPHHPLGDSFQLTFDAPGDYDFVCKLHGVVRGTVHVSSNPGDPNTEVDPIPPIAVDVQRPTMTNVRLNRTRFPRTGTAMQFGLDERAAVDAEVYRLRKGRAKRYAGYREWSGHIGFNSVKFGGPSPHFHPRPGRYRAVIIATDESNNTVTAKRLRFAIAKKKG